MHTSLTRLRARFVALIPGRNQTSSEINQNNEVLFRSLFMVSGADRILHKKEKKFIQKQYRKITNSKIDSNKVKKYYEQSHQKVDMTLRQLYLQSENMTVPEKRNMFVSAVDIAIADRELVDEEIDLLLRIKDALRCTSKEYKDISTKKDIIKFVKSRRRIQQSQP